MGKYDSDKRLNAIEFVDTTEKWRTNPLQYIDKHINDETNFAITKLTENGKYAKGDHLYYIMKGITIVTDINNIIFVDLTNNICYIQEFAKIENSINQKNPEDREYVLLLTDNGYQSSDNDDFKFRWEPCTGRTQAYETLKANLPVIDIDKSLVLVENVTLSDSLSVREFIEYLQNSNFVPDEIDLGEYIGGDYI